MIKPVAVALVSILFVGANTACAESSVISVSGSDDGWIVLFSGQAYAVSWSQTETSLLTSVRARLSAFGSTTETGKAFLSTSLGIGTTTSSLIAQTSFTFPSATSDLTLFSDLNLPAGTYYLSLIGDSPSWGSGWFGAGEPTVDAWPGTALGPTYGFGSRASFLPSSDVYFDAGSAPSFSVVSPIPEPTTTGLFAAVGIVACASRRCRQI